MEAGGAGAAATDHATGRKAGYSSFAHGTARVYNACELSFAAGGVCTCTGSRVRARIVRLDNDFVRHVAGLFVFTAEIHQAKFYAELPGRACGHDLSTARIEACCSDGAAQCCADVLRGSDFCGERVREGDKYERAKTGTSRQQQGGSS